jgi:hypothetical protein
MFEIEFHVRFNDLTAVVMNVVVFWDPYMNRRFGGNEPNKKPACCLAPAACWFLAWLILGLEDGSDAFIRNVCYHTDYTALYPGRCRFIQNIICRIWGSHIAGYEECWPLEYNAVQSADVLEESVTPIFRSKEYAKQLTRFTREDPHLLDADVLYA